MGENRTEEVEASQPETVEAGDTEVSVNSSADANVTVQTVERVSAPDPSPGSEFVGGVSVDVSNSSGEVEASGNVSIGYDQDYIDDNNLDEDSMQVYYYNSTLGEWTSEDVEIIRHDTGGNTVTAEADHFSTYGAFAEESDEPGSPDDDEGDVISVDQSTDEEEPQPENQTQDQNQTEPESPNQEDEEQVQNQTQEQDSTDSEQVQDRSDTSNLITGQFLGSPTNAVGLLVAVLVAMIGFLEYSGRIEIYAFFERMREKVEELR
jgi:hypothetical protein